MHILCECLHWKFHNFNNYTRQLIANQLLANKKHHFCFDKKLIIVKATVDLQTFFVHRLRGHFFLYFSMFPDLFFIFMRIVGIRGFLLSLIKKAYILQITANYHRCHKVLDTASERLEYGTKIDHVSHKWHLLSCCKRSYLVKNKLL